jgi:hypothetical protein
MDLIITAPYGVNTFSGGKKIGEVTLERLDGLARRITEATSDGNAKLIVGDYDDGEVEEAVSAILTAITNLSMVLSNASCTLAKGDEE